MVNENYIFIREADGTEIVCRYSDAEMRETFTEHEIKELADGCVVVKKGKWIDFRAVNMLAHAKYALQS